MDVDIAGLSKGVVLAALFNAAGSHGRGLIHARPGDLSPEDAQEIYEDAGPSFDYLFGRPLKINLAGDALDARLYDRDNGEGTAEAAISLLRNPGGEPDPTLVEIGVRLQALRMKTKLPQREIAYLAGIPNPQLLQAFEQGEVRASDAQYEALARTFSAQLQEVVTVEGILTGE